MQLFGCKETVAIVDAKGRLGLWWDFHKIGDFRNLDVPGTPIAIACGSRFVAVILKSQVLLRIDSDGKSSILCAKKARFSGGAQFVAVSASEGYIIAVDIESRAWILGEFNGFPQATLESTPVFESVRTVFAFPHYAIGITKEFKAFGIGRLPSTNGEFVFVKFAEPRWPEQQTNYVAGNDRELLAIPRLLTYQEALNLADEFIVRNTRERFEVT
jgi:hypothetical protein